MVHPAGSFLFQDPAAALRSRRPSRLTRPEGAHGQPDTGGLLITLPGAVTWCGRSDGWLQRLVRDAAHPVRLAQGQQVLGLRGKRVDGGLGHALATEDTVVVAARADLGALGG